MARKWFIRLFFIMINLLDIFEQFALEAKEFPMVFIGFIGIVLLYIIVLGMEVVFGRKTFHITKASEC